MHQPRAAMRPQEVARSVGCHAPSRRPSGQVSGGGGGGAKWELKLTVRLYNCAITQSDIIILCSTLELAYPPPDHLGGPRSRLQSERRRRRRPSGAARANGRPYITWPPARSRGAKQVPPANQRALITSGASSGRRPEFEGRRQRLCWAPINVN